MGKKRGHTGQVGVVHLRETGEGPSLEQRLALSYVKNGKVFDLPALPGPIADTHAHLMSFWRVDPAEALARAAAAGVAQLTTIWDPLSDARHAATAAQFHELLVGWATQARKLFEEGCAAGLVDEGRATPELFDNIGYLAGVHPYGAPRYTDEVHARVREALDDPLCLGVGEIGLDYHFDAEDDIEAAPHDIQMHAMARQLELALERDLPVELHLRHEDTDEARTSHADAYRVLTEVGVPQAGCVLHCFGEDRATAERFCELGCYIAFGGAATFSRNEEVREAFAAMPLDRILFETDCPYMAPEPIRGLECEPALICQTVRLLAAERSDDALAATWENAQRLFSQTMP
ncbi:TatD family hydrolase [Collinsella tanakaei]|uniref:TatD family hydrolase n=1 Tax=Collinsella tanakaei TaxID=626935 RepID=UPI0025A44A85|nr:TatD family hydrolase [Collinsella tanakaei]MDM8246461.1 TatD family hydrolase [Collinsella tanakaei]